MLLGGSLLADDHRPQHHYAGIGATLATVSALGLVLGTDHLRKQGQSPDEVQAMIDQHNREVLKDLD